MHTVYIICGGLVLFLFMTLLGKQQLLPVKWVFWLFLPIWFVCAAINMSVGVSRGYNMMLELLFFLIVFFVPVMTAWLLHYKVFNRRKK